MDSSFNNNLQQFVGPTLSNKVGTAYDTITRSHFALTIDKLILNLVTADSYHVFDFAHIEQYPQRAGYYIITDSLSLKQHPKRIEKNFLYSFNVYFNGKQVAELSTNSRIHNGYELIKLKLLNHVFYQSSEGECEWYKCFKSITSALDLKLNNISYLEIAYDAQDLFNPYKALYLNSTICEQTNYRQVKKIKVHALDSNSQFIVGSINSGKAIAIYPKTQEIKEHGKDYITNYYRRIGLDTNQQIDRVELRIKNNYLKDYNIKLADLITIEGLQAVFKMFSEDSLSFFDQRTRKYDSNRNLKYERIDLIDFSVFDTQKFIKVKAHEEAPAISSGISIRSIKMAYKQLLFTYILTGKQEFYNALEAFISTQVNYLTFTPFESYFGSMDLDDTNKAAYRELTERYLKEFDRAPTPEVLNRLETFVDIMFHGFNINEVLIIDEVVDFPF